MNKILVAVLLAVVVMSCEKNDYIDDLGRVGKTTPITYWELPSTVVKAGGYVKFNGQYYSLTKTPIDHTEVWYNTVEKIDMQIAYASTAINFSKRINNENEVRMLQKMAEFAHNESLWVDSMKAYVLRDSFQVTNTSRIVEWKEVKNFDQSKFNQLFPDSFPTVFKRDLYPLLLSNTSEFGRLLSVLNVYEPDQYKTFIDSIPNPNTGKKDAVIKEEYKSLLKHKFDSIPFQNFLYDNATQMYRINYEKSYKINALLKVVEQNGAVGVSDTKSIEVN